MEMDLVNYNAFEYWVFGWLVVETGTIRFIA